MFWHSFPRRQHSIVKEDDERERDGDSCQNQDDDEMDKIRRPITIVAGDIGGKTFRRVFRTNEESFAVLAFMLVHCSNQSARLIGSKKAAADFKP